MKSVKLKAIPALMFIMFTAGCAGVESPAQLEPVPEIHPGLLQGYLSKENLPNSLSLLSPAPAKGAAAYKLDQKISQSSLSLRGTARWELAKQDANIHFPAAAETFFCALNTPITQQQAPHLYRLLRRSLTDAGQEPVQSRAPVSGKQTTHLHTG